MPALARLAAVLAAACSNAGDGFPDARPPAPDARAADVITVDAGISDARLDAAPSPDVASPFDGAPLADTDIRAIQNGTVTVGITDHAVEQLGDLAFVDLPAAGTRATRGKRFGEIESTKAVADLVAPVSGDVVEMNAAAANDLELISSSPFDKGWLIRVKLSDPSELESLLSAEAYAKHLESEEH